MCYNMSLSKTLQGSNTDILKVFNDIFELYLKSKNNDTHAETSEIEKWSEIKQWCDRN